MLGGMPEPLRKVAKTIATWEKAPDRTKKPRAFVRDDFSERPSRRTWNEILTDNPQLVCGKFPGGSKKR